MTAAPSAPEPEAPRPLHTVEVSCRRGGVVTATVQFVPRAGARGKPLPLTPDDIHLGIRALGVLLRSQLYPVLPLSASHVHQGSARPGARVSPLEGQQAPEDFDVED